MLLKLQCAYKSPGDLVQIAILIRRSGRVGSRESAFLISSQVILILLALGILVKIILGNALIS